MNHPKKKTTKRYNVTRKKAHIYKHLQTVTFMCGNFDYN